MKKKEALKLAPEKVDVIMEYIEQILGDEKKVFGKMKFSSAKINKENMCTLDIYVYSDIPLDVFEKHINLGITSDHRNIILKEFLDRVIDYLPHETIGITQFYSHYDNYGIFNGIDITNATGSRIRVNMYGIDKNIKDEYVQKYQMFVEENSHHKTF